MTTAPHTLGPWYVDDCDDDLVFSLNGLHIATVGNEDQPDQPSEEITANARLIAAAPTLLSFIEQIARMTMDGEPVNDGNDTYYDFVMENDDVVSTLNQLIKEARDLAAKVEGGAS